MHLLPFSPPHHSLYLFPTKTPTIMGNLFSTCSCTRSISPTQTPVAGAGIIPSPPPPPRSPSPILFASQFLTPHTTHIIVTDFPSSPDLWLFQYRLNFEPIVIGQRVALYRRAADCYNPDPEQAAPVAEGQIDSVFRRTRCWVIFHIVDGAGEQIARLGYPYYPNHLLGPS